MSKSSGFLSKEFYSFLVTYIVGAWGIVQFVDWISNRYEFSNVWTDSLGLSLVLFLPSVILFSWLRAKDNYQFKRSNLIYTLNLLLVIICAGSFIALGNSDKTTEQLTIEDEFGQEKKIEVSKREYIRQIAFLPFDAEGEDHWQSLALPNLMSTDLMQSKRFNTRSPLTFYERFEKLEYKFGEGLPESIKRKLLVETYCDYLVSGQFTKAENNTYDYEMSLIGKSDKAVLLNEVGNTADLYSLSDSLTKRISDYIFEEDLKIEKENFQTVPSEELFTDNLKALKSFFNGYYDYYYNQFETAKVYIKEALELDDKFSEAYYLFSFTKYIEGKVDESKAAMERALQHSSRLTEAQQIRIKSQYYRMQGDRRKQEDLLQMWIKIHPEESRSFQELMQIAYENGDIDAAIEVGKKAETAGHENVLLFDMAKLYARKNDSVATMKYIEKYKAAFPDDQTINSKLGDIYYRQNNYEQATKYLLEHKTLFPLDVEVNLDLVYSYFNLGKFDQAESLLNESIALVKNLSDSIRLYKALESYYSDRGQPQKAIDKMEERWAFTEKQYPPLFIKADKIQPASLTHYVLIGDTVTPIQYIEDLVEAFEGDKSLYEASSKVNYYFMLEDSARFNEIYLKNRENMKSWMGAETFAAMEGYSKKFGGKYDEAIAILEEVIANTDNQMAAYHLYDSYRLKGDYKKAKTGFEELLKKNPYYYYYLLRYAQVLAKNQEPEAAEKVLDKLFLVWENANQNMIYYEEALELRRELELLG